MALVIEEDNHYNYNTHQFNSNPIKELSLTQYNGISQTIISMLIEMQKAQIETNTKLDLVFKYCLNNQHKRDNQIESFTIHYPPTPPCLQDKLSTRGSSSYSPCKRILLSSKSFKSFKSSDYYSYTKRFTEDDNPFNNKLNSEEGRLKSLSRNKSDQSILRGERKKMINIIEDTEEKQSRVSYNNNTNNSQRTTRSNHSSSKGKIRGFNFRNQIGMSNVNYNYDQTQPRRRATVDLFNSNHDIYDPYCPSNILMTNYTTNKNDSETGSSKPQIVSEKQVKRYWNISIAKPNQLQQKLKENLAKMIYKKE